MSETTWLTKQELRSLAAEEGLNEPECIRG
jgi:hypothetical protein